MDGLGTVGVFAQCSRPGTTLSPCAVVGATLGTSENAAQKRLGRAVERLREFFAKRGVTVGASGLVVVISANAVQAAPTGLTVTISTAAALAGTTVATTAPITATNTHCHNQRILIRRIQPGFARKLLPNSHFAGLFFVPCPIWAAAGTLGTIT